VHGAVRRGARSLGSARSARAQHAIAISVGASMAMGSAFALAAQSLAAFLERAGAVRRGAPRVRL
jgi:flagellar biosynthesis/type III secretory pathway ATPase